MAYRDNARREDYREPGGARGDYRENTGTPNFRWWIPAEGIRRDVIQADIQRYLGPEAVVRPGEGRDADRGRNGYWIAAYRTLTPAMVQDLRADSANFERSGDTGRYESSMVHRSRQHWGPTAEQTNTHTERLPSRADADSTGYSRGATSSSSYGNQSYGGSGGGAPAYVGYDPPGYGGRPERDIQEQPRLAHGQVPSRDSRETYPGYGAQHAAGYSGNPASTNEDYTHRPAANPYPQQSTPYGYPPESGHGRGVPDAYSHAAPRSQPNYGNPQAGSHPGATAPSHGSHPTSNVAQRAPPGYYLASDGRYYPESSRPSAT